MSFYGLSCFMAFILLNAPIGTDPAALYRILNVFKPHSPAFTRLQF
jgi:hypothetical protein